MYITSTSDRLVFVEMGNVNISCIYLIIGQAAWFLGQLKICFVTRVVIWKHFALFLENSHVSSVKAVCLSQRKWAERTFT